jgi:hypothetical protein
MDYALYLSITPALDWINDVYPSVNTDIEERSARMTINNTVPGVLCCHRYALVGNINISDK